MRNAEKIVVKFKDIDCTNQDSSFSSDSGTFGVAKEYADRRHITENITATTAI